MELPQFLQFHNNVAAANRPDAQRNKPVTPTIDIDASFVGYRFIDKDVGPAINVFNVATTFASRGVNVNLVGDPLQELLASLEEADVYRYAK